MSTVVNYAPIVLLVITFVGVPFVTFIAKQAAERICALLEPYIGPARALVLQQRVDALLDKAIGEAALHYLPMLQAQGLTVNVGSMLAARAAQYAIDHAPDLAAVAQTFEGALEQKVSARLLAHPAVQAATAPTAVVGDTTSMEKDRVP